MHLRADTLLAALLAALLLAAASAQRWRLPGGVSLQCIGASQSLQRGCESELEELERVDPNNPDIESLQPPSRRCCDSMEDFFDARCHCDRALQRRLQEDFSEDDARNFVQYYRQACRGKRVPSQC